MQYLKYVLDGGYFLFLLALATMMEQTSPVFLLLLAAFPVLMLASVWVKSLQVILARYYYAFAFTWIAAISLWCLFFHYESWDNWRFLNDGGSLGVLVSFFLAAFLPLSLAIDFNVLRFRKALGCLTGMYICALVKPHVTGVVWEIALGVLMLGLIIPLLFPIIRPLHERWAAVRDPNSLPYGIIQAVLTGASGLGKREVEQFLNKITNQGLLQSIYEDSRMDMHRIGVLSKINDRPTLFRVLIDKEKAITDRKTALESILREAHIFTVEEQHELFQLLKQPAGFDLDVRKKIVSCLQEDAIIEELVRGNSFSDLHLMAIEQANDVSFLKHLAQEEERPIAARGAAILRLLEVESDQAVFTETEALKLFNFRDFPLTVRKTLCGLISDDRKLLSIAEDDAQLIELRVFALDKISTYAYWHKGLVALPDMAIVQQVDGLTNSAFLNRFLKEDSGATPFVYEEWHVAITSRLWQLGNTEIHDTYFTILTVSVLPSLSQDDFCSIIRSFIGSHGKGRPITASPPCRTAVVQQLNRSVKKNNTASAYSDRDLQLLWAIGHFFYLAPHQDAIAVLRQHARIIQQDIRAKANELHLYREVDSRMYQQEIALGGLLLGLGHSAAQIMPYTSSALDEVLRQKIEKGAKLREAVLKDLMPLQDFFQEMVKVFPRFIFETPGHAGFQVSGASDVIAIGDDEEGLPLTFSGQTLLDNADWSQQLSLNSESEDEHYARILGQLHQLKARATQCHLELSPYGNAVGQLPNPADIAQRLQQLFRDFNSQTSELNDIMEAFVEQLSPSYFLLQVLTDRQNYPKYLRQHAWDALEYMLRFAVLDEQTKMRFTEAVEQAKVAMNETLVEENFAGFELRLPQNSSFGELLYLTDWTINKLERLCGTNHDFSRLPDILNTCYQQFRELIHFCEKFPLLLMPASVKTNIGFFRERGHSLAFVTNYIPPINEGEVRYRYLLVNDYTQPNSMGMLYQLFRHPFTAIPVLYHEYLHYQGLKNEAEVWLREQLKLRALIAEAAPNEEESLKVYVADTIRAFFPDFGTRTALEVLRPKLIFSQVFDPASARWLVRTQPAGQENVDMLTLSFLNTRLETEACRLALNNLILGIYGPRLNAQEAQAKADQMMDKTNDGIDKMNKELTWYPHIVYPELGTPTAHEASERFRTIIVKRARQKNNLTPEEYQKILADPLVRSQLQSWQQFVQNSGAIWTAAMTDIPDLPGFTKLNRTESFMLFKT